ncbi:hypothetical protein [Alkaliflexus imshenetskii]|uniref:hypothetical protein n=1 Tax=Alkaliflexus imshenetskii TaxID=286730 RepID=UPI0005C61D65|nr:hypothetical protein [Alkaliflexus imshenetskii]
MEHSPNVPLAYTMNSNRPIGSAQRCSICFLLFLFALGNLNLTAQSTIYKKDGSIIEATDVDRQGKVRSFRPFGSDDGIVYYISRNEIDSIKYENGEMEHIPHFINIDDSNTDASEYKNLIGINMFSVLAGQLHTFYEIMLWQDKLGLRSTLIINTVEYNEASYANFLNASYCLGLGFNYYFLRSDLGRFGIGMYAMTGRFSEGYQIMDMYEPTKKTQRSGFICSSSFTSRLVENIYFTAGIDNPLGWHSPTSKVIIRTEISWHF